MTNSVSFEVEEIEQAEPLVGECTGCCYATTFEIEEIEQAEPLVGECTGCCYAVPFED